jgi:hypothetical protein
VEEEEVEGEEEDEAVDEEAAVVAASDLPNLSVGPPSAEALLLPSCVVRVGGVMGGRGRGREGCVYVLVMVSD